MSTGRERDSEHPVHPRGPQGDRWGVRGGLVVLTEESQGRPLSPARSCDIKLRCSCQESYVSVAEITNSYIMIFHEHLEQLHNWCAI